MSNLVEYLLVNGNTVKNWKSVQLLDFKIAEYSFENGSARKEHQSISFISSNKSGFLWSSNKIFVKFQFFEHRLTL